MCEKLFNIFSHHENAIWIGMHRTSQPNKNDYHLENNNAEKNVEREEPLLIAVRNVNL